MKNLNGKVAVVTGAASGIGFSMAKKFASEGCHLALVDNNEESLKVAFISLEAFSHRNVSMHQVDVTKREAMEQLVQEVISCHGTVDILVNNAGVVVLGMFEEQSYDDMEWIININIMGVLNGCKAFIPHLRLKKEAYIINTISAAGIYAQAKRSTYSLTKHGLRGFTESLKQELWETPINVMGVYPGIIKTNIGKSTRGSISSKKTMNPIGKAHSPELVAEKVINGIYRKKSRVLVGRETYLLDYGKRLLPVAFDKLLHKYLGK